MDLRKLRYFLAIVSEGSFSRAAASLHMTQPPLSLAVSQLESQLGVQLLERTPQGVQTTPAGAYLADAAAQLLRRTDQIEQHLRDLGRGIAGRLTIAAVPSFSWAYLPPLLQRYADQCPQVVVELFDPSPTEVLNLTLGGIADVGIVATGHAGRLRRAYGDDLHVQLAHPMPLVAVLPPRLAGVPEPVDLRRLLGETWMVPRRLPRFPGLIENIEEVWTDLGEAPENIRTVSTLQTALPLIAAGMGVSLMPESVRDITHDAIVIRHIKQRVPALEAAVLWAQARTPTPALANFLALLLPDRPAAAH